MVYTDIADEIYGASKGSVPSGVHLSSARSGGIRLTRVHITRPGLARPAGRYVTLEVPSMAALDDKDQRYIEAIAAELRRLLPPAGLVLVVGVGNRRVTADALGPRTAAQVLVTRGLAPLPSGGLGLREVASISPGVAGATGIPLPQLLHSLVRSLKPAAVLCGQPGLLRARTAGAHGAAHRHWPVPCQPGQRPVRHPPAAGRAGAGGGRAHQDGRG